MKEYIHYGHDKFDYNLLKSTIDDLIKNNYVPKGFNFAKPIGIWASPVDCEYGWYDWCTGEEFHTDRLDKYFKFTIKKNSKILDVKNEDCILKYLDIDYREEYGTGISQFLTYSGMKTYISDKFNLEKLMNDYDGMELYLSDNWWLRDGMFYTWDVDSIVIWNPDIIVET